MRKDDVLSENGLNETAQPMTLAALWARALNRLPTICLYSDSFELRPQSFGVNLCSENIASYLHQLPVNCQLLETFCHRNIRRSL